MNAVKKEHYVPLINNKAEWLEKIPGHWKQKRLKELVFIQHSNVDKKSYDGESPIRLCNYVDVYKNEFITEKLSQDFMPSTASDFEIKKFRIKKNDVLITKDSETADDIAVPALVLNTLDDVVCGYHLAQIRSNHKHFHGPYLFRLFQSKDYGFRFETSAKGITRVGLGQAAIADAITPVPPLNEQTIIAEYLSSKTMLIDKKVDLLNQKAAQYAKLKQSLINESVTRGLNKFVPLKDSGVGWIGQIPAHWELKRIKEVCDINKKTLSEKTSAKYEFDYVDIGSVTYGEREYTKERMTFDVAPSRAKRIVKKGDTIISTVRTYLKAIATIDTEVKDLIVSTGFAVVTPKRTVAEKYCSYFLTSNCLVDEICALSTGVSYPATNATVIGDLFILIPPFEEQVSIGVFLDEKTRKTDRIIKTITDQIEKLKELRKTLINDVVTGKIKVSGEGNLI